VNKKITSVETLRANKI